MEDQTTPKLSAFEDFVKCKDSTLLLYNDFTSQTGSTKSADEFINKAVKSLDECILKSDLASTELKSTNNSRALSAIQASTKRMQLEKVLYNQMLSADTKKGSSPKEDKEFLSVNFALATMKRNETSSWQRVDILNTSQANGTTDPYTYWTTVLIIFGVLLFFRFLNPKKLKVKKTKN